MISKGDFEFGAVWVAKKIPDGHITAHANVARITNLEYSTQDFKFSSDVITFAYEHGFYNGTIEDFSFA